LGRDRKQKETGIILWKKKILGRDRKQKGWNNSLEEKDIGKR
jgi:hypothetical protein